MGDLVRFLFIRDTGPLLSQTTPTHTLAHTPACPLRPPQAHRLLAPDALVHMCEALNKFRTSTLLELPDYVRVSIRSGVFSSALDMMRMRCVWGVKGGRHGYSLLPL